MYGVIVNGSLYKHSIPMQLIHCNIHLVLFYIALQTNDY